MKYEDPKTQERLVEIVGPNLYLTEFQDGNGAGACVNDTVLVLERALQTQKPSLRNCDAMAFVQ